LDYYERPLEPPERRIIRARTFWPQASADDVVWVEPVGNRHDALLYWRGHGRVSTGSKGSEACFEGSLEEFEAAVRAKYSPSVRAYHDYFAAVEFFRQLEPRQQ
jgi:hypothetical protein